jgi:hypothetical protein
VSVRSSDGAWRPPGPCAKRPARDGPGWRGLWERRGRHRSHRDRPSGIARSDVLPTDRSHGSGDGSAFVSHLARRLPTSHSTRVHRPAMSPEAGSLEAFTRPLHHTPISPVSIQSAGHDPRSSTRSSVGPEPVGPGRDRSCAIAVEWGTWPERSAIGASVRGASSPDAPLCGPRSRDVSVGLRDLWIRSSRDLADDPPCSRPLKRRSKHRPLVLSLSTRGHGSGSTLIGEDCLADQLRLADSPRTRRTLGGHPTNSEWTLREHAVRVAPRLIDSPCPARLERTRLRLHPAPMTRGSVRGRLWLGGVVGTSASVSSDQAASYTAQCRAGFAE